MIDYLDGYVGIDALTRRAWSLGAQSVDVRLVGIWPPTEVLPAGVHAMAEIVTGDGRTVRADALARPGDAQVDEPAQPEADVFCEARAETRALRMAIKRAYPEDEPNGSQTPAQKRLQVLMREVAELRGSTRNEVAGQVAERNGLLTTTALSAEQLDIELIRLESERDTLRRLAGQAVTA